MQIAHGTRLKPDHLALRVQMDRNYLSLIELGRSSPSVRMLGRLYAALNVRAAEVLSDVERRVDTLQQF